MSAGLPRICSGDMYATASNTTPAPICEATVGASTLAKSPSGRVSFAHTEVEDFDAPVAGKKNVFRLEVAVEDAFIMCCNQPSEQFGARNLSLCGRAPDETESAGEASHLPEVPSLSKVSPGRAPVYNNYQQPSCPEAGYRSA
ncbi:MAG TPA: hypothetical protein VJX16_14540 [Terriglobales bacterium]|nr:hypothetical protein [Terriglobales bacterium]